MTDLAEQLKLAERHRRAGRLPEAIDVLVEVLRAEPQQANALNLFALIARETGQLDYAHQFVQHALAIAPQNASILRTQGVILRSQGKLKEALDSYLQAIRLDPEEPSAYFNIGNIFREKGQFAEAVVSYKMAVKYDPRHPGICHNMGQALEQLGELETAHGWYQKAVQMKPDFIEARINLGNILVALGKLGEASAMYVQTLHYDPNCLKVHNNLGNLLSRRNKHEAAVTSFRQALRIDANHAAVWNNLGHALKHLDRMDQAQKCFDKAIELEPSYARAYGNRGNIHLTQRRLDDAGRDFQKALELDPQNAEAHLQQARLWLLTADFERGWPEYQWKHAAVRAASLEAELEPPPWKGEPLDGKTILLHAEPDIEDTLQFVRYASMLKEGGATVLLACPPALAHLLSDGPGVDRLLIGDKDSWPPFDVHATLASLPAIFQTSGDSIPADIPYLSVDPERQSKWQQRLAGGTELKVGLAWQLSPSSDADHPPLLPVEEFGRFSDLPRLRLVCLQLGPGAKPLTALHERLTVEELDIDGDDEALVLGNLAAVIANLDLVITPDNALAHLAGALGSRVWVALPYVPDWRWQLDRADCPWYPTMRLFRQSQPGDWEQVFQQLTSSLQELATSGNMEKETGTEP